MVYLRSRTVESFHCTHSHSLSFYYKLCHNINRHRKMFLQLLIVTAMVGRGLSAALSLSRVIPRDTFRVDRYAHLGDSFAAGPGAGKKYFDDICHRSHQSWGIRVAEDVRLRGERDHIDIFQFEACSGAVTRNIYEEGQLLKRDGSESFPPKPHPQAQVLAASQPNLVTMSIGGNDVGFSDLLDRVSENWHYFIL